MTSFLTQAVGAVKRVLMLRFHYCWTHQSEKCAFKQPGCSVYAQCFDWVHYIFNMFMTLNHYGNAAFFCSNTTWKQHRWCIRNGGGNSFCSSQRFTLSASLVDRRTWRTVALWDWVKLLCALHVSWRSPETQLPIERYIVMKSLVGVFFFFTTIRVLDFDIQLCC